jgi:hypothetical protein
MSSSPESGVVGLGERMDDDGKLSLENLNLDELKTLVSMW